MSQDKAKTREETKAETREALIHAGIELFSEKGLDLPSLDEICARAGYTRGAFYVHFKDREELLAAVIDRVLSVFMDVVIAQGDSEADLRLTIERFIGYASAGMVPFMGENSLAFHRLMEARHRSAAIAERVNFAFTNAVQRVAVTARDGQAAGVVRGDVEPDAIGNLLVAAAIGLTSLIDAGVPVNVQGVLDAALRVLFKETRAK
jgi:TetR/AcrR family transcriptional repressor of nem operon